MSQSFVEDSVSASSTSAAGLNLAQAVDGAALCNTPFDHIYMENVFPRDFYREILKNLPAAEHYHPLYLRSALRDDGTSTRQRMYLYRENFWRLPREQRLVWGKVAAALCSPQLEDAFKRKFRTALEDRFQQKAESIAMYPVPILVRDLPGYRIGVHSDTLTKAITVQFYLPSDNSQAHIGTIFHTTKQKDGTDKPVAMQFLPASGYAFPVRGQESWHSAAKTSEADGERRSIMLTYYVDGGLKKKFRWRLQRAGILFGRYPKT